MTGDPELRALAAAFPLWRIRRSDRDGTYTAWLPAAPGSPPPWFLRADTTDGLRTQLEDAERDRAERLRGMRRSDD